MDIALQIGIGIVTVLGLLFGSFIATKVFGRPKSGFAIILEIITFVILITLTFSYVGVLIKDPIVLVLTVFVLSLGIGAISRAVSTGAGFLGQFVTTKVKERISRTREEKLLINTLSLLFQYGASEDEARSAVINAGYSPDLVDAILNTHSFEREPNPYLRRIIQLEDELKKLKSAS